MSRQQKRDQQRKAAKDCTRKFNPPKDQTQDGTLHDGVVHMSVEDLNKFQQRGLIMWKQSQSHNGMCVPFNDEFTWWTSSKDSDHAIRVSRAERNIRGRLQLKFTCKCRDFENNAERDCKHIFAEKLRLELVVVIGDLDEERAAQVQAKRGPTRKRKDHKGRPIRGAQRRARREMPTRIPQLAFSLKKQIDLDPRRIVIPTLPQIAPGGRKITKHSTRALALLLKVASGTSVDAMYAEYDRLIDEGLLPLRQRPCENTISNWMNDPRTTPVLREFLRVTTLPFREREIGAVIDSSKISQLMTAHSRQVDYGSDERYGADWMKCHTLVGVETMIVMAVEFSGVRGNDTHDINFLKLLVTSALETFPLEYLLGDKAYLSEDVLKWLWSKSIKAVVPLKKRWWSDEDKVYHEAITHLVEWYHRNENADFHDVYKLRPKIEAFFSLMKRLAKGYCWSRGRRRKLDNSNQPSTAWINELLCKFIYMNLRATVTLELETGYRIDYTNPNRRFPSPAEPLLQSNRLAA